MWANLWRGLSVYFSPRVYPLLLLGFASGLPLALTGGTLQAWATVAGPPGGADGAGAGSVGLQQIGMLTLVGSAYTLKFLWAPLVDRYAVPLLGRRRGWMLVSQLLLGALIGVMGTLDPGTQLWWLALLAVLVAFCSATQDIAFDAYSADVLREQERAAGAALKVMGYRLGMTASGGLALILAGSWLGWRHTYMLMGALMALCALATWFAPEPEHIPRPPRTLRLAVVEPLRDFFSRPGAWMLLLLIVLYKLGDAFAGALSTTFLLRGVGFGLEEVGAVTKIFGLAATIVGALMGGALLVRAGLYRSLMMFGVLQAVSNLGYWLLAALPADLLTVTHQVTQAGQVIVKSEATLAGWLVMGGVVGLENICGGLGTAAFVALLMALCQLSFSATQFALLSALSAVGRTYLAGPLTPPLVQWLGWPGFFVLTVFIAVPGLVLLRWMRPVINKHGG
jgi:PAT family beta-lactamase induction signal transducer AmpG